MADANTENVKTKILTGARALVTIGSQRIGFFTNVAWSIRQEKMPEFVVGSYGPMEITSLSQEPVQVTLSGFRVISGDALGAAGSANGGIIALGMTKLSELLNNEVEFNVKIEDRQTGNLIFGVYDAKVIDHNGTVAAKSPSDLRMTIMGLRWGDESAADAPEGLPITAGTE